MVFVLILGFVIFAFLSFFSNFVRKTTISKWVLLVIKRQGYDDIWFLLHARLRHLPGGYSC